MNRGNLAKVLDTLEIEVLRETSMGWLLAHCPFAEWTHSTGEDRNPDFWVKTEEGGTSGFHCFSCKQKGPIPSLVKRLEYRRKVSYGTLYVESALWESDGSLGNYEVSLVDDIEPEPINPNIYAFPKAWAVKASRDYLEGRGISEKTAEKLMLLYDPDARRVVFPVANPEQQVFGFTGRTVIENYDGPKVKDYPGLKKERFLLGEHLVKPGLPFLVVEGLFALAHMIEIGADQLFNVVAIMGSSMSKYQRDILIYYNTTTYLLFDDDLSGVQGLLGTWNDQKQDFSGGAAIDMLKAHVPTLVPGYPEGVSDPDDLSLDQLKMITSLNVKLF